MNRWILIAVIGILSIAFVPLIISGTASLVASGINSVTMGVHSFFSSLTMSGDQGIENYIKLALWLVFGVVFVRIIIRIFGNRG
jgi:hypothetical protein